MAPFSRGGRGVSSSWRGKRSNYSRFKRSNSNKNNKENNVNLTTDEAVNDFASRQQDVARRDAIDSNLGFARLSEGTRVGWLINMHPTSVVDDQADSAPKSAVDYYFIQDDGDMFKATIAYQPYFLIACRKGFESQVEEWLLKKFDSQILRLDRTRKEDLKLPNHLLGHRRTFIQIVFKNIDNLLSVRLQLLPIATANREKLDAVDAYAEVVASANDAAKMDIDLDPLLMSSVNLENKNNNTNSSSTTSTDPSEYIVDIREYDVPYYLRVAIDKDIRVGLWYTVTVDPEGTSLKCIQDRVERPDPVVMAFDIETTKDPLKFPDSSHDQIMMISYMIDGQGFLITNREIVSENISDFDYTPKVDFEGVFTIFNVADERAVIERFFDHFRERRPTVIVTYNGDSFDFPFVQARAAVYGIDMLEEIGFTKDSEDEFKSRSCAHMDCFRWVKRDSYLPQGSQGLKAVTVAKLGYDPMELDPELMTPYARDQPQVLAQYSVSDAVATYYLYMQYVHPFIFSLCNIIPLNPDEVLRKGTGTLCETLLMVEAYKGEIIMPNRHVDPQASMFEGHLLESETYVGGHVEALEAGVFRNDIQTDFKIQPPGIQKLLDELDDALKFSIVEEGKISLDDVEDYDSVKEEIIRALEQLRDNPVRSDKPLIYHLDVAAMYPNIMLSNRLQPDSTVDEATCAACDYNRPGKKCDRRMTWAWRGEFFPAKLDEYKMIRNALEHEVFPAKRMNQPPRQFAELTPAEQTTLVHKRLGDYCRKVYHKVHDTKIVYKESIICQRENPFYIDTVRNFRDRRYIYKGLHKTWKKKLDGAASLSDSVEAKKMIVLYDSLQLAHKCILNSFYGYVMRKGARWHSMEMAGITCLTGASIIQMARQLVEQIGRPLELDTDGIWCMLPCTFPDKYSFKLKNGKSYSISYPCTMLNHLVHAQFTNDQYHKLEDPVRGTYSVHKENSIFFELDGPYRAMILPSSKEEDKLLKKRYAVFNDDGSLAELKGFEVKRRGELQLIKIFQTQIFERFLLGHDLQSCYAAVAVVADQWLDVLFTKARNLHDDELVELIAENRSMSKTLAEYGGQKSTSISTAKRLAEFLGDGMIKDKGLACKFIISSKPLGAPVTDRAVPVAIFHAEESIKKKYLRKWLRDNSQTDFTLRGILDWDYYIERLGSVVQKLITIPAAMQKVPNPVPRIRHPDWLLRRVNNLQDKYRQHSLIDMFQQQKPHQGQDEIDDLEDAKGPSSNRKAIHNPLVSKKKKPSKKNDIPTGPPPDMNIDFPAWLRYMKPIWRKERQELASASSSGVGIIRQRGGALDSMVQQQTMQMSNRAWDIVQISEIAERHGEFKMWLLIGDRIQIVRLQVPRVFYLNMKQCEDIKFPSSCTAEENFRTLPRGAKALNLIKVTVNEYDYLDYASEYSSLIDLPDVLAAYETQITLFARALIKLGSSCKIVHGSGASLGKALDHGFSLDQLEHDETRSSVSSVSYLDRGSGLQYAYFYHAMSDTRHVFAFYRPPNADEKEDDDEERRKPKMRIIVVDRSSTRQVPNLTRYYSEQLTQRKSSLSSSESLGGGVFKYPDEMEMEVSYSTNEDSAFRVINRELTALITGRGSGPTMLITCCSQDRFYYESRLGNNLSQFPIAQVHASRPESTFHALGWQEKSVKRMIQHFLRVSHWMKNRIIMADRYKIPVCNLGRDVQSLAADLDFSRRLVKSDMLLWWSPGLLPDLGGLEADANLQQLSEDLINPTVSKPGCYSNAAVELELKYLAINSVIQSAHVYEVEGSEGSAAAAGGGSLGFTEASHNLDEYAKGTAHADVIMGDAVLPTQTLAILKTMVKGWVTAGSKSINGSREFRILADHFWRWISSPASAMFDPAIHRFVHGLMCKTFSQLVAEFRRLGSQVIYGDFNRLILLTSKPCVAAAYAYANYIASSVNSRELFKLTSLETVRFYEHLLWMDPANQAMIINQNPESSALEDDITSITKKKTDDQDININFNLALTLPPVLQDSFASAVAAFLFGLRQAHVESSGDAFRTPLRILQNAAETVPDPHAKKELDLAKEFISKKHTRQMLRLVEKLTQDYADADEENAKLWEFPALPGSLIDRSRANPVLEFIKTLSGVMSLSRELIIEVQILKRNMVELIGVREFASEATFKNPCATFRLPTRICQHCAATRDFDLVSDPDVVSGTNGDRRPTWCCLRCGNPFDMNAIEATMIEMAQRIISASQLQDLRCRRCERIKAGNLSMYCSCSGTFKTVMSREDAKEKIKIMEAISEHHHLRMVHEVVIDLGGHLHH